MEETKSVSSSPKKEVKNDAAVVPTTTSNNNNKNYYQPSRKKRKLITRTTTDEDGFIISEDVRINFYFFQAAFICDLSLSLHCILSIYTHFSHYIVICF